MSEVIARIEGMVGRITLNRPGALHALNEAMCLAMTEALLAWRSDDAVRLVLIEHAPGTRGFCAGGDIRMIAESGAGDGSAARAFFLAEYRLNHLLFTYEKPVVALMDGVTMGGGVGISAPARYRFATERTLFAMPETGIGLFPDVGGGWHLPRLPGAVGMWLALTGARLKGADCVAAGVATHFASSAALPALVDALLLEGGAALASVSTGAPDAPQQLTAENRARIDRIYSLHSVEAMFAALQADGSEWAQGELATLRAKSPQTLKVAHRQLVAGAKMANFADEMRVEYRIACRVIHRNDFQEGVRAVIVDKDNAPRWAPANLEGVTDEMLEAIFAPLPPDQEWTPLP